MADPNLVRCFTKTVRDMIEEVLRDATSREEYDNRVLSVRMWFGQHLENLTFGLIKLVVEDTLDDMTHAVRERFFAADARLKNVKLEVQWRGHEPIDASFEINLDSVGPGTPLSEDNVASVLQLLKERDEGDWLLVNMEEQDVSDWLSDFD